MTRTKNAKPRRDRLTKMADDGIKFELKEITDPAALPKNYLVIPEDWPHMIEKWDARLQKDGKLKIKQPLTIHRITRIVKSVELCLELESLEAQDGLSAEHG